MSLLVLVPVLVLVLSASTGTSILPYHFGGNILVPQCVMFEGTVRTGPPPK
jgi:hypothetical protein